MNGLMVEVHGAKEKQRYRFSTVDVLFAKRTPPNKQVSTSTTWLITHIFSNAEQLMGNYSVS